jgi:peptidoglycan/xylan/chitin deacetylase (PgdA/CDA1 family)
VVKGLGRAKRILRHVKRQFRPAAVILMYHRIADVPVDPRGTAVSPENFAQHLEYVQRTCHPMRLLDLVEALRAHSLPRRAVVITFDDGHASVFERACPLLASAQIPATVFIATGSIDDPREFWWDELDRVLLLPENVPEFLHLTVGGQGYKWATGSREERLAAYHAIRRLVRTVADEECVSLLSYLCTWASVERTAPSDCHPMTSAELFHLAQDGLVELGAHTVTHPVLAALPADDQRAEILGSRASLEGITRRPVLAFAYPYGRAEHFTDETVRIVQAAGFRVACTARQGLVEPGSDLFRLHRCEIQNWDIVAFRKHLEWLFVS